MHNKSLLKATAFIIAILFLTLICFYKAKPKLAVIDMRQALAAPAKLLAKTNLSSNKQQIIIKEYATKLPYVIRAYGKKNHLTLITATCLANYGSQDITQIIVARTLEKVLAND